MRQRKPFITRLGMVLLMAVVALVAVPVQAEENAKLAELKTSLNKVPDNASLYIGMFRAGEQVEVIGKSKAWAKLVESPAVQVALTAYKMQCEDPDSPASKVASILEDPQAQDLMALLADMYDDEAFVYADESLTKLLALAQKFQRLNGMENMHGKHPARNHFAKLVEAETDEEREKLQEEFLENMHKHEKAQAKRAFALAAKNLDALKVPTVVFGWKLDGAERAEINLGKLEFILSMGLMQAASMQPETDFKEVLKREKINGGNFLVLTVAGKMIPWEENDDIMRMADEDENAKKVLEKLKSEKLVVAIGVQGEYMLMSIGSSLDEIKKFGQGTALVTRPEMAKIELYAEKPIVEIDYVSKDLMALNASYKKDMDLAVKFAGKELDKSKLTKEEKGEILGDLKKLNQELKNVLPEPGAMAAVSYMTPTGIEEYVFSWSTCGVDGKSLELLNHVGGSPILAIASVCPLDVESYDAMTDWVEIGWGYFEKYGLPNMPEKKQAKVKEAIEAFRPIVAALHETTREKFLPAFGGEFAFQVDGELTLSSIPEVNKAMPVPEPAIILAVKDKNLMDEALCGYWDTLGDALAIAVEKCDKMDKNAKLPEAKTVEDDTTKMYVFDLPAKCPARGEVKPTVGLGENTLVFAATPEAAQRLMKKTPLTYGGVLSDAKKSRLCAGCFSWKNLLVAGKPWVMFGVEKALEDLPEECPLTPDMIRTQAETMLEVLSTIRTITGETYRDGDVTVQHSRLEVKDLD